MKGLLILAFSALAFASPRVRRQQANCNDAFANVPSPCTNNPAKKVYFPHPTDNSKFIQCDELGRMYIVQCPSGTQYNGATASCVAPVTQPPSSVSNNPCTVEQISKGHLYFDFPGDSRKFIECDLEGHANVLVCPDLLVWDETRLSCVYEFQAGKPTPSASSGSTLTGQIANPCSNQNIPPAGLFFPHPDPTKFIQCGIAGDAYVLSCPSGLVWNGYSLTCVSPYITGAVIPGN